MDTTFSTMQYKKSFTIMCHKTENGKCKLSESNDLSTVETVVPTSFSIYNCEAQLTQLTILCFNWMD